MGEENFGFRIPATMGGGGEAFDENISGLQEVCAGNPAQSTHNGPTSSGRRPAESSGSANSSGEFGIVKTWEGGPPEKAQVSGTCEQVSG